MSLYSFLSGLGSLDPLVDTSTMLTLFTLLPLSSFLWVSSISGFIGSLPSSLLTSDDVIVIMLTWFMDVMVFMGPVFPLLFSFFPRTSACIFIVFDSKYASSLATLADERHAINMYNA